MSKVCNPLHFPHLTLPCHTDLKKELTEFEHLNSPNVFQNGLLYVLGYITYRTLLVFDDSIWAYVLALNTCLH